MCTGVDPDDTIHEIFQEAKNTVTRDLLLKSKRNSNEGSCSDREEDLEKIWIMNKIGMCCVPIFLLPNICQ